MTLKIQIICFIFSFLYGVVISFLVNLNYDVLFNKKLVLKILADFFFFVDLALLYFIILRFINQGILHIYFLILLLVGFFSSYNNFKKIRQKSVKSKKNDK